MRRLTRHALWIFPALWLAGSAAAIEKPDYKVLEKDGKLELRLYASLPVASAPMGDMEEQNGSFMKLFRYIEGDNEAGQKIAMTAPVFMEIASGDAGKDAAGRMSFMIPAEVAQKGAPDPTRQDVTLRTLEAGKVAVIRFKGHRSALKRENAVARLRAWVTEQGWQTDGEPFFAYYDPPWTPELLRRNEVWVRIAH